MNFKEIDELDFIEFYSYLRDAVIYNNSMTKEGREYLNKCWILEQDKMDRNTLRQMFGRD